MNSNNNCSCPTGVVGTGCHTANIATSPYLRNSKSARLLLSFALVFGVMLFANAIPAFAQAGHGAGIVKSCVQNIIVCDSDAECGGAEGECQENRCQTTGNHVLDCTISIFNIDEFNDTLEIQEGFDIIQAAGGNVRNPTPTGNLPISAVVNNSGLTTCVAAGALPCLIGPGDIVRFRSTGYSPTLADFNQNVAHTLSDQGNSRVRDTCNAGAVGCDSVTVNTIQFVASTQLVSGCSVVNKDSSTACADTDNNDCTTAGCNGAGACDQAHIPLTSTPCDDVAGTECADPGCSNGVCVADHFPKTNSTTCTDTDGNECTTAGCDGAGGCDQNHVLVPNSTACTDTDQIACTTAGCDGAGNCDQNHIEDCPTGQGCTPGFWKANFDKKGANAWPTTNVLLGSVFTIPACLDCDIDFANLTLRQALDLQGGKDACGKAEILLRAAAAAYLNSLSTCVQFELSTGALVAEVNAALANCDASAIITEATRLDGFNNAGCPLNQQGQCSNP